jgi:SAM-dependent methyltransferase
VEQIDKAKANGIQHAFIGDAQDLRFPESWSAPSADFDAVFTNAALHWCKRDPAGVILSARSVLRSGGRFVGEFGGFTNCVGEYCVRSLS